MLDFSSLEFFSRRDFLKSVGLASTAASGLLPFGLGSEGISHIPDDPLEKVRTTRFKTLVAIIQAQIDSLWCGRQGDSACQVAREILVYANHLPKRLQYGINIALLWLDIYSIKHIGRRLHKLSPSDLRRVLNQGEVGVGKGGPPRIVWCDDHLLHTAVSGITMLGRLVLHSRQPARELIGGGWSKQCENAGLLVSVEPPRLANLSHHYDVCIIGSGAGGATVANRLSAAGLKVLILDIGNFVSPDALIQQIPQEDGSVKLAPPRSDQVLYTLYKDAAGQIAGGMGKVKSKLQLAIPSKRKKIPPKQTVNVCQAKVFGGGPYVNNAIHLPMLESVYDSWGERQPADVDFFSVFGAYGVNLSRTRCQYSGDRSPNQ